MSEVRCPRCATGLPGDARFCTACGARVGGDAGSQGPRSAPAVVPGAVTQLVECEACGAGNAPSRALCARCATPMRDEVPGGDALPDPVDAPAAAPPPAGRTFDTSPVLLSLVLLAGLMTAGVLLALVTSQVARPAVPAVPTGIVPTGVTASSALDGHPPALVIDGDTTTAWTESGQGDGTGQFIEVVLPGEVEVGRVLVWNGDQGSEQEFLDNGRAARLRIHVADRQFRVDLLDIQGPQAIDLPGHVRDSRVRIVIEDAVVGDRYTDLAISEVVIEAAAEEGR